MKRLSVLACSLFLLTISVPALQAAEADVPETPTVLEAPATPAGTGQLGSSDAPVATAAQSCPDPYFGGTVAVWPQGDPVAACTDKCAESGGTYYGHVFIGYVLYECSCCPI